MKTIKNLKNNVIINTRIGKGAATLFFLFLIIFTDDADRYSETHEEFVSHEFFISWCTLGQDVYTNLFQDESTK